MAKVGYCGGCGRRVELTQQGECPNGHLRSMLRDVRDGVAPPVSARASVPTAAVARSVPPSAPNELLAAVIGKSVVIVPLAAIIAFALWTGYEESVGSGTSAMVAVLLSVGSLALTVGGAFVWFALKKRKR